MKKSKPQAQSPQAKALTELRSLIDRAKGGDRSAVPLLREFLDLNPALWRGPGDIAVQAQGALVKLIAGNDLHLRECLVRKVNDLKRDLVGQSSSPLERLLAERVVTTWLQLGHMEAQDAQNSPANLRWAELRLKRQAQAERQFRAAIADLAALRRLAKPITVEVRPSVVAPSPEPILIGPLHRELPPVNGTAKPINGHNRLNGKLNGHNRITGILESTKAE